MIYVFNITDDKCIMKSQKLCSLQRKEVIVSSPHPLRTKKDLEMSQFS